MPFAQANNDAVVPSAQAQRITEGSDLQPGREALLAAGHHIGAPARQLRPHQPPTVAASSMALIRACSLSRLGLALGHPLLRQIVDDVHAHTTINGMDQADLIEGCGEPFATALNKAGVTTGFKP